MFANHRLAFAAAEMEVQEAKARLHAQNQLAAAQTQVLPRRRAPQESVQGSSLRETGLRGRAAEVRRPATTF